MKNKIIKNFDLLYMNFNFKNYHYYYLNFMISFIAYNYYYFLLEWLNLNFEYFKKSVIFIKMIIFQQNYYIHFLISRIYWLTLNSLVLFIIFITLIDI